MKTTIPENWQRFHQDVLAMSDKNRHTLTELYKSNKCTARQPRIYKELKWIIEGYMPKGWVYVGPKNTRIDEKMAELIREKSKEIEKRSDPLGLKTNDWKMPTLEETGEAIKERRARELQKFWDGDLVTELRRRGYEVKAIKTVEL